MFCLDLRWDILYALDIWPFTVGWLSLKHQLYYSYQYLLSCRLARFRCPTQSLGWMQDSLLEDPPVNRIVSSTSLWVMVRCYLGQLRTLGMSGVCGAISIYMNISIPGWQPQPAATSTTQPWRCPQARSDGCPPHAHADACRGQRRLPSTPCRSRWRGCCCCCLRVDAGGGRQGLGLDFYFFISLFNTSSSPDGNFFHGKFGSLSPKGSQLRRRLTTQPYYYYYY